MLELSPLQFLVSILILFDPRLRLRISRPVLYRVESRNTVSTLLT
jgi:hypothetical protein